MADHPIKPTNFLKYAKSPLLRYILRIIPANAKLKSTSKIKPELLGKIPGTMSPDGEWTGFDWPSNATTEQQLMLWQQQQANANVVVPLAAQTGDMLIGIDFDVENETYLNTARDVAERHLGVTPVVRRRDGSIRCVLIYRHKAGTPPIRKFAGAYLDEQGQKQLIETLGSGQQVVLEGPHAKGAMHYWEGDRELVDHLDEIPEITVEMVGKFYQELNELSIKAFGFEKYKMSLPGGGGQGGPTVKISDPESLHLAGDRDLLTRALQRIDLDDPSMDYDAFINLLRAICAAVGGDMGYLHEVVWPWVCANQTAAHGEGPRTEERGVEWLEERWVSFTDSQLGIEYVYGRAADFGFNDGLDALAAEEFKDLTPLLSSPVGDGDRAPGDAGGADGSAPTGNGPTPLAYTDRALADLFAAQHPTSRYTPDEGWVKLEGGVYIPDHCVLHPIGEMCSAVGDPYRAQGRQGVKVDVGLKSTNTVMRVERRLRSHPAMFADPQAFDVDPWLLNTPSGIVDLRDGNVLPHGMLMRNQTAVAPNFLAMVEGYEQHCPRWMAYLNFIADGRDDVIPFLRRWGGGSFVGTIFELYFLFIHGLSGTGKTVYLDVLSRLAHLYGTPVSKGFFMRSLEKRTFELYQTFKKRAVFSDEVPKGSTWDEMMLLTMLNGSELHAEGKGKAFLKFRSVASITITGNHRPAFVTSAEESGIDRRLLVLECNKKIADHMPDNTKFAREIVAEEGPSIMAFFVQGAMEGWQSLQRTGSFYGDTVKSLVEAARGYRRAANPFLQWINEEMEQGEGVGFDYESKEAFKDFVAYMREQNPKYHILKEDFRNGLDALGFKYGQRTQGKNLGRLVFKGFRPKPVPDPFGDDDDGGAGNVVKFHKP